MKWYNLWQTPNRWANGQTNKLAALLSHQPPTTSDTRDPPGHPVVALTVSLLKVLGGVRAIGLLFLTLFRVFDSQLANSLPVICKYQHAPPEARFVFRALLFLLSVPTGSWSYKCLDSVKLSQAFVVPVGSDGRVCTRCRSQTCYPQGSFFFFF